MDLFEYSDAGILQDCPTHLQDLGLIHDNCDRVEAQSDSLAARAVPRHQVWLTVHIDSRGVFYEVQGQGAVIYIGGTEGAEEGDATWQRKNKMRKREG